MTLYKKKYGFSYRQMRKTHRLQKENAFSNDQKGSSIGINTRQPVRHL